mgnify:CR=1 FL=1|jgi:hypothetical protein|tara:strand:- start:340 stop:522 length:183 start_codon:yes stop_codon:yes gene_type:complete
MLADKEQMKLDNIYESLMKKVKDKDYSLYCKLRSSEITMNQSKKNNYKIIDEQNQYQFIL